MIVLSVALLPIVLLTGGKNAGNKIERLKEWTKTITAYGLWIIIAAVLGSIISSIAGLILQTVPSDSTVSPVSIAFLIFAASAILYKVMGMVTSSISSIASQALGVNASGQSQGSSGLGVAASILAPGVGGLMGGLSAANKLSGGRLAGGTLTFSAAALCQLEKIASGGSGGGAPKKPEFGKRIVE